MATKKPVTLQDYIDKYLDENKELTSPKSYAEFIMHGGRGAAIVGSEGRLTAEKNYSKSLSTYGKRAEALGSDGLSGSGYASYINDRAERQKNIAYDMARGGEMAIDAENRTAYAAYLAKLGEEAKKMRDDVIKKLEGSMITDYDRVYNLALMLGLEDKDAGAVAKLTTETAIKTLSDEAMMTVVDKRMSKSQAQKYAESLGLPKAEAEKIANYAEYINQKTNYNDISQSYLDHLREQIGE